MPELPEVETVRRSLLPLRGAVVKNVWTSGFSLHQKEIPTDAIRSLFNEQEIVDLRRKGKYLLLDSALGTVLIHLGMSGRLCIADGLEERPKHTHFVFEVEAPNGELGELRFIDPRRFGQVMCFARSDEYCFPTLSALGLDPFDKRFSADFLFQSARKTKRNVKTFLLDQKVVAGLGNIYASEVLWHAGISPTAIANRISKRRVEVLANAIPRVLCKSLERGGTTFRDFVDGHGNRGDNAAYLAVYGREYEQCLRNECQGAIKRKIIAGRSTFYCPRCQKY